MLCNFFSTGHCGYHNVVPLESDSPTPQGLLLLLNEGCSHLRLVIFPKYLQCVFWFCVVTEGYVPLSLHSADGLTDLATCQLSQLPLGADPAVGGLRLWQVLCWPSGYRQTNPNVQPKFSEDKAPLSTQWLAPPRLWQG